MTRSTTVLIGPLSHRSGANGHYIPQPPNFAHPDKVCNSLMANMTSDEARQLIAAAPVRPGSEQFRQYRSRGLGC